MYDLINEQGKKVFSSNSYYEIIAEKNKRKGEKLTIKENLTIIEKKARKEIKRMETMEKLKKMGTKIKLEEKKEDEEEGSEITDEELDDFEEAVMGKEFRGR